MSKQIEYYADNVDANGKVFPTVGENIRYGAKGENIGDVSYKITPVIIDFDKETSSDERFEYSSSGAVTVLATAVECAYLGAILSPCKFSKALPLTSIVSSVNPLGYLSLTISQLKLNYVAGSGTCTLLFYERVK